MIALAFLLLVVSHSHAIEESVDMVEVNHFHDSSGNRSFDQVVFWRWYNDEQAYHVGAWKMDHLGEWPVRHYPSGLFVTRWRDYKTQRVVKAKHFRESWTQRDPERDDKCLLHESDRLSLVTSNPTIRKEEPQWQSE